MATPSGYSLVVERILAKDKIGVRFSVAALKDLLPTRVDKHVNCGDKGHVLLSNIYQIDLF